MLSTDRLRLRVGTAALVAFGTTSFAYGPFARAAEALTFEIVADDMCCAGCAKKVAAQLYTAPGVINVKATVATRTVVVTAKPSQKLTLERLWNAVEKGKGKPSRLVAFGTVYTLTRPADLSPEERSAAGVYTLGISDLTGRQSAERVAKVLYGIRGVSQVSIDKAHDSLIVEPASGVVLSPWSLISAVEQAKERPLAVIGPHGRFDITAEDATTRLSSRPAKQGENR